MMSLKCICFLLAVTLGAVVSGAPKKSSTTKLQKNNLKNEERISAFYVKDEESGDLRFLTGSSGSINQLITQKQDLLEQLRPSNSGSGSSGLGTSTGGSLGSLGTLGSTGSSSTGGVTPIIVSLGNGGGSSSTSAAGSAAVPGPSPISGLLPQIIAQAVFNSRRRSPNRNGGNRRRVVNNRRRPGRRGNNKQQVYVIRPN